jgi:hypothetical protein
MAAAACQADVVMVINGGNRNRNRNRSIVAAVTSGILARPGAKTH